MKKKMLYDILFYIVIPLSIWNFGRIKIGDYYAMLLTTVPGIVYTVYGLVKNKQYNVTGIYILAFLIIGRTLDLCSKSALSIMWNGVYTDILRAVFLIFTMAIKKPMGLFIFVDYANMQGHNRKNLQKFYAGKGLFKYFQYLTAILALNQIEEIFLKVWLIGKYGAEGFNQVRIIMGINNYVFSGLMIIYIIFMVNRIKQFIPKKKMPNETDIKYTNSLKLMRLIKIVYFSGTGSTARVADYFEHALRSRNLEVIKNELKAGEKISVEKEDMLIVIYSVHACNAPEPVYEWIKSTSYVDNIPAVVISVSGGGEITPNTACRIGCIDRLQKKGYTIIYEKMIVMPSNWIIQTNDGLAVRLLEILPYKVDKIISEVLSGVKNRTNPNLLNRFLSLLGELEKVGTRPIGKRIKVSENCNGCGWCKQNCPRGNIVFKDNRPVFENKCILCLRCIYGCPKNALKPGIFKFIIVKEGYNLSAVEERMKGVELAPVEDLAKGYLWKGIKEYLLESGYLQTNDRINII